MIHIENETESLKKHKRWLSQWVAEKIASTSLDPGPLVLKLAHTLRVLSIAGQISVDLPMDEKEALALAALYHDVARFDQYLRFQTFKDARSFNHGFEAVKIIKKHNRLAGLEKKAADQIMCAVALHNRAELPGTLNPELAPGCQVIRDADKLDILRVMSEHLAGPGPRNPTVVLSLPDSPEPGSPELIKKVLAGQVGSYASLRTVNDFRALLGSWFYDLHSRTAKNIFIREGCGAAIVADLPKDSHYGPAREKLLAEFSGYEPE